MKVKKDKVIISRVTRNNEEFRHVKLMRKNAYSKLCESHDIEHIVNGECEGKSYRLSEAKAEAVLQEKIKQGFIKIID